MFSFTKEELEARVASLLEGTTLSLGKSWVGGLFPCRPSLFVEIHLPVGFRLIHVYYDVVAIQAVQAAGWPILGHFCPEGQEELSVDYQSYLVVQAPDTVGRGRHVFKFPWLGGDQFDSHKESHVTALCDIFRIPI